MRFVKRMADFNHTFALMRGIYWFYKYSTMERIFYGSLMALAILFTPWLVVAHPGHGHDDGLSLKHYLANFAHLVPVLLTVGVAIAILTHIILMKRGMKPK